MAFSLFEDLVWVMVGATLSVLLSYKLKAPAIIGFIISGILVGPSGLGLVANVHEIELIAEIGIILLLFTIGVEFSVAQLSKIKSVVLFGGGAQVGLTTIVSFFLLQYLGMARNEAIVISLMISLSSTAVVLKMLQDRGELSSLHGRTALGILLFQDVMIVPIMLILPMLTLESSDTTQSMGLALLKGLGIVLVLYFLASKIVPWILTQVARTRSQELFLIAIVGICFSVALITSSAGLSLALGALIAGLIISESSFSHQVLDKIFPFQQLFTSIFFISIGMLLDINIALLYWPYILLGSGAVILVKSTFCLPSGILLGFPFRTAMISSLMLAQVGEFSFILSKAAKELSLLTDKSYQIFLAVSVVTIILTPLLFWIAPRAARFIEALPLPPILLRGRNLLRAEAEDSLRPILENHLVLIGYGFSGRAIAKEARSLGIPYVVTETNPDTVAKERKKGVPIVYGDASIEATLKDINISSARVAIIAVSDPFATKKITSTIERISPKTHTIVRTRFVGEIEGLYQSGADEVVPQEFESTIELLGRALRKLDLPSNNIDNILSRARAEHYRDYRNDYDIRDDVVVE